jgi:gluconate 2-dehydrogenase gamma chain
MANPVSRRDILKGLALGGASSSALRVIPLQTAVRIHELVRRDKASASAGGGYTPRFFTSHQYKTLQALCQTIIPPDDRSAGAIEAGAPEFIDLLTSENKNYQLRLGGGLMWLDATCSVVYGKNYLDCNAVEQKQILDLLAYRENARKNPSLSQGISFFALLRNLTIDGFFTSEIGIKDLHYLGNTFVTEFLGCPPVPKS